MNVATVANFHFPFSISNMSFLDYFIQPDFPCTCGGPSFEWRERVEAQLTRMLTEDPTPLPDSFDPTAPNEEGVPGAEPLVAYTNSSCPCQIEWTSLGRQLMLVMSRRNQYNGSGTTTETEFHRLNYLIRSLLDIFTGKRYETYYKTSIQEIMDAFA